MTTTDLATIRAAQTAADRLRIDLAAALRDRDEAIRAAVADRGVRPVARELGLSSTSVSRIARRTTTTTED